MLKKLFIHEWKAFWKVPAVINLCLLIMTVVGIVSLISPFWTLEYEIMDVLMFTALMLYYLSIIAGSIAVCVYIAVRYYKNIYTDEGYLTNTLPVTPRQLILSKLFVSTIWNAITSIVITISVFLLIHFALVTHADVNIFSEMGNLWTEAMTMLDGNTKMELFSFFFSIFLMLIITPFYSNITMYSSIALGQMFTKHKVAGAVIWYIVQYMILQFISALIMNIPLFTGLLEAEFNDVSPFKIINPLMYGTLLLTIAATVILYFITEYLLKKKLNLD